ncbi:MAG: hypothetical protein ACTSU3_04615, partial [Candidatus Thorarchaeota archaeon]
MVRHRILITVVLLLVGLPFVGLIIDRPNPLTNRNQDSDLQPDENYLDLEKPLCVSDSESEGGILDPVLIEHTGSAVSSSSYVLVHNDVTPTLSTEVFLPAGHPDNQYSADCTGGYFLVGAGGSADFGSPAGTISLWIKWDGSAPHGRFWGQDFDFETRWAGGAMVLDMGGDTSLTGSKTDWLPNHWYFLAIVWDETTNFLGIYWGDEETSPVLDSSTSSWPYSVVGYHSENDLMTAAARATTIVDGHVDDFRYFNIRRNLENITADYNMPLSGSEEGLTHYYELDADLSDSVGSQDLVKVDSSVFNKDVPRYPDAWVAEQIEVNVRDINELYVLNGTFDTGVDGTNEDWSGDGSYYPTGWLAQREVIDFRGRQRASYIEDDGKYVILENEGYAHGAPISYSHYNDTRIYWYQTIDNSEGNENFTFSLNYLYESGPLGTNYEDIFELRFEIRDGSNILWNWSVDLVNVTQRQQWYSVNPLTANIPGAPTTFEARVVLEVNTTSGYVDIPESDSDLDGDSTNGMIVSVHIDDVSFEGEQSIIPESVELFVRSDESGNVPFKEDSGIGYALINNSYWMNASIPISFSANTSISFEYSTRVSKMLRFYNSTYSTNLNNLGVNYDVALDESANLTLYTYVQSYPEAEDLGFKIHHPSDWTNVSIEDPLSNDITNQSIFGQDIIEVPSGYVDSVGWWIVRLSSPNYGRALSAQKYNDQNFEWESESIFRSDDRIRCNVSIGTVDMNPVSVEDLEIRWYLPSGSIWSSEIVSNGTGYLITSTSLTLGLANASTGIWLISVHWINGTEIAFASTTFEVHHKLTAFALTPNIEAQLDENFTVAVYLQDQNNGEVILSEDVTMVGNWSATDVYFSPNLAKGWWEADFNSSLTGTGSFSIVVNASIPYYDSTNCTLSVQVSTLTVLTFLDDQYVEIGLGYSYDAYFKYMFLDETGIIDANITVISWSGPTNGLVYGIANGVTGEPGNYSIEFTPSLSGTYYITLTGSKEDHTTAAASFYLIVGAVLTEIELLNGTSGVISADKEFQLTIRYTNDTGAPLSGANMTVVSSSPSVGILFSNDIFHGDGVYSISLTPTDAGTYYLLISVNLTNHELQYVPFTLSVTPIASFLTTNSSSSTTAIDKNYTIRLFFQDEILSGLENSTISILSIHPFTGVNWTEAIELGGGYYLITLIPQVEGTFEVVIRATLSKYQNGTAAFYLIVTEIPTQLDVESGVTSGSVYFPKTHNVTLIFKRTDVVANITGAIIEITSVEGLVYSIYDRDGVYIFSITPTIVGKWSLIIRASLNQYRNASLIYEFEVEINPSVIEGGGPPEVHYYNQTYFFVLWYGSNGVGIHDATVNITYHPIGVVHSTDIGDGFYEYSVRGAALGEYAISVRFSKYGYLEADRTLEYEIIEIPTTISIVDLPDVFYEMRTYPIQLYYNSSISVGVEG